MPDISANTLTIAAFGLLLGILAGWLLRGSRIRHEKDAIHEGWQEQLAAQKSEHDRIAEQNRSLMEQISQYSASRKDQDGRAKELSESLQEALAGRQKLEAELLEARRRLDVGTGDPTSLRAEIEADMRDRLRKKDKKISRLSRELEGWQNRLPPLIGKFRERSLEAEQLEAELEKANGRITELEQRAKENGTAVGVHDDTRVETIDGAALAADLHASNEGYDDTLAGEAALSTKSRDSESTGAGRSISESGVDFDLGKGSNAASNTNTDDATLSEIFEGDGTVTAVDEWLEAGETPVTEVESLAGSTDGDARPADSSANGYRRDDLKQIKGVGPAIEKTLNDLGIHNFEQIARMSEGDIDRVANELRGFRKRIDREDWIGQARMLQHSRTSGLH